MKDLDLVMNALYDLVIAAQKSTDEEITNSLELSEAIKTLEGQGVQF